MKLDLYDIVALNAFEELPGYYVPWVNEQTKAAERAENQQPRKIAARSWPMAVGRKTTRS